MFDWLKNRWYELPVWARWVVAVAGIAGVYAIPVAVHEDRPFAGWFEEFAALLLYGGLLIGGLFAAILGGMEAGKRWGKWAGWVCGILIYFMAGMASIAVEKIPGIGWRIERIFDDRSDDY